jgi:hypothetical protein
VSPVVALWLRGEHSRPACSALHERDAGIAHPVLQGIRGIEVIAVTRKHHTRDAWPSAGRMGNETSTVPAPAGRCQSPPLSVVTVEFPHTCTGKAEASGLFTRTRGERPAWPERRRPRRRQARVTCVPTRRIPPGLPDASRRPGSPHRPQRPPLTSGPVCAAAKVRGWGGVAARTTAPEQLRPETAETVAKSNRPGRGAARTPIGHPTAPIAGAHRRRTVGQACRAEPSFDRRGGWWRAGAEAAPGGLRAVETEPLAADETKTTVRYRPTRARGRTAIPESRLVLLLPCVLPSSSFHFHSSTPASASAARVLLYRPSSASSPTHHSLAGPRLRVRVEIQIPRDGPSRRSAPHDT